MDERRKAPRKKTDHFIGIYQKETDEFIGKLLDLSTKGMMISALRLMIAKTKYDIRMLLPMPIGGKFTLTFEAECVWCCESPGSDKKYKAGFNFTDIYLDQLETIECLLNDALFHAEEEQPRLTLVKKST